MMSLIITILAGAFIGWIASMIMKTNASMGAIANILCGIVGAFVGGMIAKVLNIETGGAGFSFVQLLFGILGACIVIGIYKAVAGNRPVRH
ncbi:MAG TPA: GlsB/YeaQ/YmgE family stress response membrane protein [Abditibacteriaceae bacterium]|jgi:uncharacterized membrane protein YeaQ/YmgE (transglycosylase-associated protein family)